MKRRWPQGSSVRGWAGGVIGVHEGDDGSPGLAGGFAAEVDDPGGLEDDGETEVLDVEIADGAERRGGDEGVEIADAHGVSCSWCEGGVLTGLTDGDF